MMAYEGMTAEIISVNGECVKKLSHSRSLYRRRSRLQSQRWTCACPRFLRFSVNSLDCRDPMRASPERQRRGRIDRNGPISQSLVRLLQSDDPAIGFAVIRGCQSKGTMAGVLLCAANRSTMVALASLRPTISTSRSCRCAFMTTRSSAPTAEISQK